MTEEKLFAGGDGGVADLGDGRVVYFEGVDDIALVVGADLVRVGQHQFVEPLGDLLRTAHGLDPGCADAVRQAGMA